MEKSLINYSFKEKFFSIQPEGRIRRYQFLARSLAIGLLIWLFTFVISFVVNYLALVLFGISTISIIPTVILLISSVIYGIYYYSFYHLAIKRIRDIGWKNVQFFRIVFLLEVAIEIIKIFLIIFEKFFPNSFEYGSVMMMISLIRIPFSLILCGYVLCCIFVPGKKGNNEFGKDPINTKVEFWG